MKTLILLVAIVAAGFGGYSAWVSWRGSQATSATPKRPTTAVAERRNISFAVNAAGEITPAEQVSVRPEINGKIEALPVDLGDKVRKGDLLFKLDDRELQQQRASNLTDVSRARLGLEKAERDLKRAEELLREKPISQELYDDTKTARDLAKVAVERSEKDLAIIEERLTKTEVRAPFDCTVLTRPVSTGQAVSGSGGFNSGTEVLTIADLNSMIINAHVNQADVPRLKTGQVVEVAVEAVAGLKVTGEVERIAPQSTIRNNIKGYATRIVLKHVDPKIRPGMTANIKIPVGSAENVTSVPLAAVYTERDTETGAYERFVYVVKGPDYEKRNVKVGISDFFYAEIQEGLTEGEVIALELPKEERDKKSGATLAATNTSLTPAASGAQKASTLGTTATNTTAAAPHPGTGNSLSAGPTNSLPGSPSTTDTRPSRPS